MERERSWGRGGSGNGNGGGSEQRSAGRERGRERGRGWGSVDEHRMGTGTGTGTTITGTGTRIGSGRAEERRKSARNRKIVVDAVRETVETRVEKEKKCRKERVGSVAANPDNLEINKEAGRGAQGAQGSSKNCTSRESVSPLSRLIRGFHNKYH